MSYRSREEILDEIGPDERPAPRECGACRRGWHEECPGANCGCGCNYEGDIGTCQTCGAYWDLTRERCVCGGEVW